jgi:glutaredoxin-related protein
MLKIYGSMFCPDCVKCRADLDQAGVAYEYLDFSEDLRNLKAFLALRDGHAVFAQVRENGKIGIPCIVDEAGNVSLDWEKYM